MNSLPVIDNKTILTATGGFLGSGFTHSVNPYSGCGYAGSCCGEYCYVQHNAWLTKGNPWGFYGVKANIRDSYRRDYDRLKSPRRGQPKPLRVYCSSSTDPYTPQEKSSGATRALLEEMLDRPPDALVLQTRSPLVLRDFGLIAELAARTTVWVSITVETDYERLPGFPPHASSPAERIEVLKSFRSSGVPTQATCSPMCPIKNLPAFANALDEACDRIICDHYLLGDGSKHGLRTKRTRFPQMLEEAGFGAWNTLDKFDEVVAYFRNVLGDHRVLESASGFNDV